jgi:hypothetical protein
MGTAGAMEAPVGAVGSATTEVGLPLLVYTIAQASGLTPDPRVGFQFWDCGETRREVDRALGFHRSGAAVKRKMTQTRLAFELDQRG